MDSSTLEKGKKLQESITKLSYTLNHFEKGVSNSNKHIEFLENFFNSCRNLEYPGGKEELAKQMIVMAHNHMKNYISGLEKEFEEL